MHDCNLNHAWMKAICECESIKSLDLSLNFNLGKSPAPPNFGNLQNTVTDLSMEKCDLNVEWIKPIFACKMIQKLNLNSNHFGKSPAPPNFGNLHDTVTDLSMEFCHLDAEWIKPIFACKIIQKLSLNSNHFGKSPAPHNFESLQNTVTDLSMEFCHLDAEWIKPIFACKIIQKLSLNSNHFGKSPAPHNFESLQNTVTDLSMEFCHLDAEWIKPIFGCKMIQKLNLSKNYDLGKSPAPPNFGNLQNTVTDLSMRNCNLNLAWMKVICECESIKSLDLSSNETFGRLPAPPNFGNVQNTVTDLSMRNCYLNLAWMKVICECESIKSLDLSSNETFGRLPAPPNFGNVQNTVTDLSMRNCYLNLAWMKVICECESIKSLDFSWNREFGRLPAPPNFGNLQNTVTDLSMEFCDLESRTS